MPTKTQMRLLRLKNITDNFFQEAWQLYEEAFPIEERKLLDEQSNILKNDNYHYDVLIDQNQFIGFILWWDFESYKFIDHFATSKHHRNKGIGSLILEKIITLNTKPILLEVELPTSNLNKRRIEFYTRHGFKLNQHYYEIPSVKNGQSPLQLLLMSHPNLLTASDVDIFIQKYHPIIYKKQS